MHVFTQPSQQHLTALMSSLQPREWTSVFFISLMRCLAGGGTVTRPAVCNRNEWGDEISWTIICHTSSRLSGTLYFPAYENDRQLYFILLIWLIFLKYRVPEVRGTLSHDSTKIGSSQQALLLLYDLQFCSDGDRFSLSSHWDECCSNFIVFYCVQLVFPFALLFILFLIIFFCFCFFHFYYRQT